MKSVVAIEASSRTYAVAVGDGEQPSASHESRRDAPGFAGIGELVKATLAAAGLTFGDIEAVGVDVGPGGLTSIRAAVAYANGLAFSLGRPIFPVTSLELMAIAARQAYHGPFLCLKRGQGGNCYAGLFADDGTAELRHGLASEIVPPLAGDLETVRVAGMAVDEVAHLLPGVTVTDAGISEANVAVLYGSARAALSGSGQDRLVPAATAINEASRIFHEPAASHHWR